MPLELSHNVIQLSPEHEMFAALVVSGASAKDAAELAGFVGAYATQLAARPDIQARIAELIQLQAKETEAFGTLATRAWIEAQLVVIARTALQGRDARKNRAAIEPDLDLARRTLMDLAKLKGLIIERKQVARATVNLGDVNAHDQLQGHLQALLDNLEPGERKRIEARLGRLQARKAKLLEHPTAAVAESPAPGAVIDAEPESDV